MSLRPRIMLIGFVLLSSLCFFSVESKCSTGCDLALGSYYITQNQTLTEIANYLSASIADILSYNPQIPNQDSIQHDSRINIPFSCDCIQNGQLLAHVFQYTVQSGETYFKIANTNYANLTTVASLQASNSYSAINIPTGKAINVTVNCTCGNSSVSTAYGVFITYPLRPEDTLSSVAKYGNISTQLLQSYNPDVNFTNGTGLVYIPTKDTSGSFRPLTTTSSKGALFLLISFYPSMQTGGHSIGAVVGIVVAVVAILVTHPSVHAGGITVDKSVEFSYEELANATDNFSISNQIGQGGFGAVYYAELRGEKAAIKKMAMQASKEFIAELTVLTNVHHLNLVRLIGYCTEGSLFVVYEYVENGNLSQHLRGSGRDPLSWSARVQIALDSARGLEYIHEHTVPVYIHRDIKSANILIDRNFHGKVADFGLTKLTEAGTTRLVGTFGYMPPEYAQYGEVSAKVDVYAFGVVLYELISAKEAVVKDPTSITESKGLVGMFEVVHNHPDPNEICKLIDPRMEDNYPLDAVLKMAQVAKACTNENPQLRPTMRSVAVALITLSSATEDWNASPFYDNHNLVNLMSGR
ncbi:hypothetical protein V2J09_015771 [Rumex salicifolius]